MRSFRNWFDAVRGDTDMTTLNKRTVRSDNGRLLHIDGMSLNSRYSFRPPRSRAHSDSLLGRMPHRYGQ